MRQNSRKIMKPERKKRRTLRELRGVFAEHGREGLGTDDTLLLQVKLLLAQAICGYVRHDAGAPCPV